MFSHLHVGPLPHAGTYIVYNIHDDGVIRARAFQLEKGTAVFMDAQGTPILKLSCGNPMVAPVPPTALNVAPGGAESPRELIIPSPVPTPPIMPNMAPATPEMPPTPPVAAVAAAGHVEAAGGFLFLPILLFFNNHSSCSCNCCNQPVPEPGSVLVMGFGASCLLLRRKRKVTVKA